MARLPVSAVPFLLIPKATHALTRLNTTATTSSTGNSRKRPMTTDPNIDAVKDALDQIAAKDAVEAALIADLSGQLETTIETLRGTLEHLEAMTAERDALQAKLDVLEPEPEPEPTIEFTPDLLRFIGGYRLPECWYGGKSIAFTNGGITGRHDADGRLRLWVAHHAQETHVVELIAPTSRSTDMGPNTGPNWTYDPVARWPIASQVRIIPNAYQELRALDGAVQIHGLHWSEQLKRLLVSGRSWYNTTFNKEKWLVQVDVGPTPVIEPAINPGVPQQPFGGGFVDIPQAFADAYCGGNTIGLSKGGYESGQASATSPTLAAWGNATTKVLQHSGWNVPTEQRELRDSNYDATKAGGWQPMAKDGVGWWGVDRVMDSAWIDTDDVSALVFIVQQPTGKMDYALQGAVFSNTWQFRLYIYDPKQLAEVAEGKREPWNVRGKWYPLPKLGRGFSRPYGMWWDTERKILSVLMADGWWPGGSESYPVVLEFEVGS